MIEKWKNFNNVLGEYLFNGAITIALLFTIVIVILLSLYIAVTFIQDLKEFLRK